MTLLEVWSGGQTGADRAGLDAALEAGLRTGGWMPKGFLAKDGCWPEFATKYNIKEHDSPKYPPRTACNVRDTQATIKIAAHWSTPGERLTQQLVEQYGKPFINITPGDDDAEFRLADWLDAGQYTLINVAGNSEDKAPGIYRYAKALLLAVFKPQV